MKNPQKMNVPVMFIITGMQSMVGQTANSIYHEIEKVLEDSIKYEAEEYIFAALRRIESNCRTIRKSLKEAIQNERENISGSNPETEKIHKN